MLAISTPRAALVMPAPSRASLPSASRARPRVAARRVASRSLVAPDNHHRTVARFAPAGVAPALVSSRVARLPSSRRGAPLARAATDDDAPSDKFALASAVLRLRRSQDDCLDAILEEMATLSREVQALRREVAELKRGDGALALGDAHGVAAPTAAAAGSSSEARDVREMLDALIPPEVEEEESGSSIPPAADPPPFPDLDAVADVPVVIDAANWRGDGTDRSHLWPACKVGEDDIYLMSTIQEAMNDAGYWAGEEDEADMYFGASTQDALCYFQAGAGLPETGFVDADTWKALLGPERFGWGPVPGAIGFDQEEFPSASSEGEKKENDAPSNEEGSATKGLSAAQQSAKDWSETVKSLVDDEDAHASGKEDLWGRDERSGTVSSGGSSSSSRSPNGWPTLRLEDGGVEVHKLQVLLDERGYYSGEEDMEYWFFGSTTENALGTFQASNGLPDTGVACERTWIKLFGEARVKTFRNPEEAIDAVGDGDYPEDLSRQDRVFLLGEGRFEGSAARE